MGILEELAFRAIRLGLAVLEVEYKDGYEEVFGLTGGVGFGIARFRSTSREAAALRAELRQIARKARRLILQGGEYEVRARVFDSFGETAYRVALRPARKSRPPRRTLAPSHGRAARRRRAG